ncbi:hypothetical protein OLL83_001072 [Shewanella algae]|uniref:hypothetical protein n=1 Tax=Shewanella algae TaxID=38313 RepID=UPI002230D893|nr:hypothetical protein [Shewanella algae]UZD59536.1 hypothetical protein OLL83_001072 [Shewanella algae]
MTMTTTLTSPPAKLYPSHLAYIRSLAHKDYAFDVPLTVLPLDLHIPTTGNARKHLTALRYYYEMRSEPIPEPVQLYMQILDIIGDPNPTSRKSRGQEFYRQFKQSSSEPLADVFRKWVTPAQGQCHDFFDLDMWFISLRPRAKSKPKPKPTKTKVTKTPKPKTPKPARKGGRRAKVTYTVEQLQAFVTANGIRHREQLRTTPGGGGLYYYFLNNDKPTLDEVLPVVRRQPRPKSPSERGRARQRVKVSYTVEQLKSFIEATSITTRTELKKINRSMYNWLIRDRDPTRLAILDDILPPVKGDNKKRQPRPYRPLKWSVEKIRQVAKELNGNRSEFCRKCKGGYQFIRRSGLMDLYDELFPPRKSKSLTEPELIEIANGYATRITMLKQEPSAYRQLYKRFPETLARLFPEDYRGRPASRIKADKEFAEAGEARKAV